MLKTKNKKIKIKKIKRAEADQAVTMALANIKGN
jgi:hypothetical protein